MKDQQYSYLVLDDGEDGFIQLSGKAVVHATFRNATTWPDNRDSIIQMEKLRRIVPSSKIYRVKATFDEV